MRKPGPTLTSFEGKNGGVDFDRSEEDLIQMNPSLLLILIAQEMIGPADACRLFKILLTRFLEQTQLLSSRVELIIDAFQALKSPDESIIDLYIQATSVRNAQGDLVLL